jgi:hypothetical protein
MSGRDNALNILLLLLTLLSFGCAAKHSPNDWLDSPHDIQTGTHGGWLYLETKTEMEISGELIAISNDSIFVANETLHVFALSDIKSARLEAYDAAVEHIGGWLILGTVSSISNGFVILFTGPMWILGGGTATILRSYEPILEYPDQELSSLLPFARFPQGLPTGIDRRSIKMKPGE